MKLFITNKKYFEKCFTRSDYRDGVYKNPKQIHQLAYNELIKSVGENSIPIILSPEYKDFGFALFEFKSKKGDVFFYEFLNTAS